MMYPPPPMGMMPPNGSMMMPPMGKLEFQKNCRIGNTRTLRAFTSRHKLISTAIGGAPKMPPPRPSNPALEDKLTTVWVGRITPGVGDDAIKKLLEVRTTIN